MGDEKPLNNFVTQRVSILIHIFIERSEESHEYPQI